MSTYNGVNENLKFSCKSCAFSQSIEIDLGDVHDKERLWQWLYMHSADGGKYENIPLDIEKIPVAKRTNEQHLVLIKRCGGVREYLLSMGAFKKEE